MVQMQGLVKAFLEVWICFFKCHIFSVNMMVLYLMQADVSLVSSLRYISATLIQLPVDCLIRFDMCIHKKTIIFTCMLNIYL